MPRVFIHREEGEWQILGLFSSLEQAQLDLFNNQDILPGSWTGPEDINGTPWYTSGENYIIGYEVPDA